MTVRKRRRAGLLTAVAVALVAVLLLLSRHGPGSARRSIVAPTPRESRRDAGAGVAGIETPRTIAEAVVGVVRDLADGTPVRGVEVELLVTEAGATDHSVRCVSDDAGRLNVAERDQPVVARSARIVTSGWQTIPLSPEDSGEIWAYRDFVLHGVVRVAPPESPVDWAAVRVDALSAGTGGHTTPASQSPRPWGPLWLKSHGFDATRNVGPPRSNGTFDVHLPRIRGITVRAYAPGWRVAWETIAVDSATTERNVSLELHRAMHLRGVLVAADGSAVASATVVAYVVERGAFGDLSYENLRVTHPYGGFTTRWSEKENSATATSKFVGTTDDRGRFDIELGADGEAWVLAYASGFHVVRQEIGAVHGGEGDETKLHATRLVSDSRTQLVTDGVPLRRHSITISDVSFPIKGLQPAFAVETDDTGTISTAWLDRGRTYVFSANGPLVPPDDKSGFGVVLWTGQDTVDFRQLPKELDE